MKRSRNRKINYETCIQFRISNELKEKMIYKSNGKISEYIRNLIEKDLLKDE